LISHQLFHLFVLQQEPEWVYCLRISIQKCLCEMNVLIWMIFAQQRITHEVCLVIPFPCSLLEILKCSVLVLVDTDSIIIKESQCISNIRAVELDLLLHDLDQSLNLLCIFDLVVPINELCRVWMKIHTKIDILTQGLIILYQVYL